MNRFLIDILLYVLVAGIGFSVFSLFMHSLILMGHISALDDASVAIFTDRLLKGSMLFWLGGCITGLFYFWVKSAARYFFLLLPVILPLAYCITHSITQ